MEEDMSSSGELDDLPNPAHVDVRITDSGRIVYGTPPSDSTEMSFQNNEWPEQLATTLDPRQLEEMLTGNLNGSGIFGFDSYISKLITQQSTTM